MKRFTRLFTVAALLCAALFFCSQASRGYMCFKNVTLLVNETPSVKQQGEDKPSPAGNGLSSP